MERYVLFLERYKGWIVAAVTLAILLFGTVLKDMAYEGGYRIWFAEGSGALADYDDYKARFGSDDVIVIAFREPAGIFGDKAMGSVSRLNAALREAPYIERVVSLAQSHAAAGGAGWEAAKRRALADPAQRGLLVSEDGTTAMLIATVAAGARDGEDRSFAIQEEVDRIVDAEAARTGYVYHVSGAVPIQTGFTEVMIRELLLFIPLIALSVGTLLFGIYRRISAVVVPMGVVGLGIVAVVAAEVAAGYRINNFTADIPVFMLAIGIAAAVHLYTTWQHRINEGDANGRAVTVALRMNLKALFFTSLTTALGFASLAVSDIVPVYTLGLATAGGVMLNFLLVVVLMPAMLLLMRPERRVLRKRFFHIRNYGAFVVRNDTTIVLLTTLFFGLCGAGLTRLQVDSNLLHFLDDDVKVRQATEFVTKAITGPMGYEIVVDAGRDGGVYDPAFLRSVAAFQTAFKNAFAEVRHLYSLADAAAALNGGTIPGSKEAVAAQRARLDALLPEGSVAGEGRYLHIGARTDMAYSRRDLEMIAWAEGWWRMQTRWSAKVYGQTAMFARMQSEVTDTLLESIGMSVALVSLVMLLLFRKLRLLYVYILPNLLPFVLVLGVMGWLGIAVDLGVAISGAVILGIAVDDTMHFLVKYFGARKRGLGSVAAFDAVMEQTGQAIMVTTLILSAAFTMLVTSDFIPNAHFAVVTATALLIAVAVDLLFLPALLSLAEGRQGQFREGAEPQPGFEGQLPGAQEAACDPVRLR